MAEPFGKKKGPPTREEKPYSFLECSIKIYMVDDDPIILETYSEILRSYPLYSIKTFSSATEANSILSSNKRSHVCIMDLGLTDMNNDEFYLVKKFSPRTSFIVLTGNDSVFKGFQCGKNGSFSVFKKPVDFGRIDFLNTINEAFIYSLITPGKDENYKPIITKINDALIFCNPMNISEWAFNACVTEQYLRRVWNTMYGYQPKYILFFYKMMIGAFSFHNTEFLKINGVNTPIAGYNSVNIEKESACFAKIYNTHENIFNLILH